MARYRCAIMFVALVIPLFSTIIAAQPMSSVLLQNTGTISYQQPRIVYLTINATGTYELNYAYRVVAHDTNSLTVLNHAIGTASQMKGSLFVYNGTYQVSGTINMQSNVNMTLQDGVFINETANANIFSLNAVADCSINAHSNATIHGGVASYSGMNAFYLKNVNNVTIGATQPNGLIVYNIGYSVIQGYQPGWVNNSLFQNIWAYNWMMSDVGYDWHAIVLDGVQNTKFINLTVDGLNGHSRCPLTIGGQSEPSNNIIISGGLYENSHSDNGIYLGAWQYPVTNVLIVNVTTAGNNAVMKTGHSGLKFRPASNVTVINWTSNGDYNGMELGSTYQSAANPIAASYNNVTGVINNPVNVGLILSMDYADVDYHLAYNWFNIAVNNAMGCAVWVDNPYTNTTSINNNIIYLNATGSHKQALDFADMGGNVSYNTVYGRFVQNGRDGFPDISLENTTAQNYNVINVYSTYGNPNGLYSGKLGTNTVTYPYSGP